MTKTTFFHLLGITTATSSHREKIISGVGGFLGIITIFVITTMMMSLDEAIYIVPSMGASAVLLFAAPHVPFSQPWNVFGGHLISAAIGVSCAKFIPDVHLAAAASVGIAISVMYYTRCIHPPGGATALAAVIGGSQIQELGYLYLITPILIDTLAILLLAVLFNAMFPWRRYPGYFASQSYETSKDIEAYKPIKHGDFVYALSQIDSFIDISEADLLKIYSLATKANKSENTNPQK